MEVTMVTVRSRKERGVSNLGWLDSRHSFSFGRYIEPEHMGFRALRVINEDRVVPGAGFPRHGHADMEIISYVLDGALEHKDTIGTTSVIRPGDVQRMSAGTGIEHSEYNASSDEPVHFLQIWLLPDTRSLAPGYEQKSFSDDEKWNRLRLVASRDGRDGSITVHQDVNLYAGLIEPDAEVTLDLAPGRQAWVQVARGQSTVNGQAVAEGDGVAITAEDKVTIRGRTAGEVLLFDLA
jgi:redox-sensitive bicupin YhaK (pirin superfamily)